MKMMMKTLPFKSLKYMYNNNKSVDLYDPHNIYSSFYYVTAWIAVQLQLTSAIHSQNCTAIHAVTN